MTDHDTLTAAIAKRLQFVLGRFDIYAEHTGGGIYCVFVPVQNDPIERKAWIFGMANETWGGDLLDEDGNAIGQHITTDVPSDSTDVNQIADAIIKGLLEAI
jgi:hypothetical protein